MLKDKLAYCVIDTDTMEIKSKFYKRKSDAKAQITNKMRWWKIVKFGIAEFEYKQHYVLEEE